MDPGITSKGLPVVSQETIDALFSRYDGRKNRDGTSEYGQLLQETKQRLIEENPALADFLKRQAGKYPEEYHLPMFEVLIAMYLVLELQGEANILENLTRK